MRDAIEDLQEKFAELESELGTDGGGPGALIAEVEDMRDRLDRWQAGKDTGYRSEIMMTSTEMKKLQLMTIGTPERAEFIVSIVHRSAGWDA